MTLKKYHLYFLILFCFDTKCNACDECEGYDVFSTEDKDGKCSYMSKEPLPFKNAEQECQGLGDTYQLLPVYDEKKNGECVNTFLPRCKDSKSECSAWLGLHCNTTMCVWADGNKFEWENWPPWEAETYQALMEFPRHCSILTASGKWDVTLCESKMYYVCEGKGRINQPVRRHSGSVEAAQANAASGVKVSMVIMAAFCAASLLLL